MGLMQQFQQPNNLSSFLSMAKSNPQALISQLMQSNSEFASFYEQNKNKTPEQAFRDNGLDFNQFKHLF